MLEDSQTHFSLWPELLHFTRRVKPSPESQAVPERQLLTFCDAQAAPYWACSPCAAFVQLLSPWKLSPCPGNQDVRCGSWPLYAKDQEPQTRTPQYCRLFQRLSHFKKKMLSYAKPAQYPTHHGIYMLTTGQNHGKNSLRTKGKASTNETYIGRQTKWSYIFSTLNTDL